MKFKEKLTKFVDGEFTITTKRKPVEPRRTPRHREKNIKERLEIWHGENGAYVFKRVYVTISIIMSIFISLVLIMTVSYLPSFGDPSNPVNNEVSQRYIEKGLEETGSVNIVTGMILDYRAFDTFGESAVLFVASASVMMLLEDKKAKKNLPSKNYATLERDIIVKNVATYIIPFLLLFGIYLVLNGHISPGGGFSGGAVMGASLILFSSAFGRKVVCKVITEKLVKNVTFGALTFYAIAKGYSFFTGANHVATGIPLGNAGDIISAGLILPLNICVGLIVTCTMYSFYSLFMRGDI
ncbi:MAG: hydrogen gas-evolving membrane-bound hydrogenase subunit E [Clostridia bacterium]